jgi:hypothetical protein
MADSIGQSYVVPPFASAVQLSRLSMLYLVSYSLGMLARYHPTRWLSLLTGGEGDASYPILNAALDLVEGSYPDAILREFERVN